MGYTLARTLRKRQEVAKTLLERRIAKRERELEKLKAILRSVKYADWGEEAEKRI